jgi:hypothetical protein
MPRVSDARVLSSRFRSDPLHGKDHFSEVNNVLRSEGIQHTDITGMSSKAPLMAEADSAKDMMVVEQVAGIRKTGLFPQISKFP